ncbi:hypothetical protein Vadar_018523 [Vaccinium darrowii]|uniref:Uncharacterized protein n=1 Tax=Vaccinium darrowii TaxID=229202 RepID=A0ACB7YFJ8_9ERIC|nr:hypothetical protein Vadar_018523 [Vaccinium darrowii]
MVNLNAQCRWKEYLQLFTAQKYHGIIGMPLWTLDHISKLARPPCFGRAAEKCHFDSLSSIVASCIGKYKSLSAHIHALMFSGTREVGMNMLDEIDVFNFLLKTRGNKQCLFWCRN